MESLTENPTIAEPNPQPNIPAPPSKPGHKRNGTVAKLPKEIRDQINTWLDDGHSYPEIIRDLGDLGRGLKPDHLSQWYKGGYQDYLRQQQWRDDSRFLLESGADIPEFANGPQMQQTLIQLALVEIFRALKNGTVEPDSPNYIRLFNALARLNREALGLRKYADATARAEANELKKLDPNRDLVTNELAVLVNQWDRAFKMPRPDLAQILAEAARIGAPDSDRASSPVASGVPSHVASGVNGQTGSVPDVEPGVPPGEPSVNPFSASASASASLIQSSKLEVQGSTVPAPQDSAFPALSSEVPLTKEDPQSAREASDHAALKHGAPDSDRASSPVASGVPSPVASGVNGQTGSVPDVEPGVPPGESSVNPFSASASASASLIQNSKFEVQGSTVPTPQDQSSQPAENHPSEIINHKFPEHCLHCGDPLPPLLPDGTRPSQWCECGSPICGPVGLSIRELCPYCSTPMPVHGYNVKRWSNRCGQCDQILPDLDVNAPFRWLHRILNSKNLF